LNSGFFPASRRFEDVYRDTFSAMIGSAKIGNGFLSEMAVQLMSSTANMSEIVLKMSFYKKILAEALELNYGQSRFVRIKGGY
jgi:hypothetical protein